MRSLGSFLLNTGQVLLGFKNSTSTSTTQLGTGRAQSCPANPPLSCSTGLSALEDDSCCLNYPGGQFAQTQFWNSDPHRGTPGYLGPEKSWTIHGLWPDHCNGRYDSVCDCDRSGDCSSRNYKCRGDACNRDYSSISAIMEKFEQQELHQFMQQYWKGNQGDESLHQHEWSKHGTCINTLEPKCYDGYVAAQEVVDYFRVAVDLFKQLPTYEWLAKADIVPTLARTYNRDEILAALHLPRGVSAVIGCQGAELREVWYFFNVRGSLQNGQFVASRPDFSGTNGPGKSCPLQVRYLPKDI
ncbi:ribonuclease T2 [Microthyrium microscopicum]|uniref:ribonuclease T2 n=1 Tax=Microthyrium microscopicum TaxID=703497 RepID=A0A6A6UUA0_9PEZI|nr:ribonuclease T2 [Microthyrium microscopicum]